MIRRATCTISAAAALALTAAAPAVACNHPSNTTNPQAQQEHARFGAKREFGRYHRHARFDRRVQASSQRSWDDQQQGSTQQSSDQQQSQQQGGNCYHGSSQD